MGPRFVVKDAIEAVRASEISQEQAERRAMALLCKPDLLIADEPTTALDVTIQAQVLDLLRELQKRNNMALLIITHDLGVIARIADRVQVMYAGRAVEKLLALGPSQRSQRAAGRGNSHGPDQGRQRICCVV